MRPLGLALVVAVLVAGCPKPPPPAPVGPPDASDASPPAPVVSCVSACGAFVRICPGAEPSCLSLCARIAPNRPSYPGCLLSASRCSEGDACDPVASGGAPSAGHGR